MCVWIFDVGLTCLRRSGFPSPDVALSRRPWTASAGMSDGEFKEECRGWSINEVVFSPSMWAVYETLLKTDFGCFDTYPAWDRPCFAPLAFPVRGFYGAGDTRATAELVGGWAAIAPDFQLRPPIDGHHLFVYDEAKRDAWFKAVLARRAETSIKSLSFSLERETRRAVSREGNASAFQTPAVSFPSLFSTFTRRRRAGRHRRGAAELALCARFAAWNFSSSRQKRDPSSLPTHATHAHATQLHAREGRGASRGVRALVGGRVQRQHRFEILR